MRVKRSFPYGIAVEDAAYTWDGDAENIERNFSYNEPYYAAKYDLNRKYGIGKDIVPYNHACPVHTADVFWRRRAGA